MTVKDRRQMIANMVIFTVSVILAWGGLIYATNDPCQFRVIGLILALIGYGIFFWAVIRYENDSEEEMN